MERGESEGGGGERGKEVKKEAREAKHLHDSSVQLPAGTLAASTALSPGVCM